MPELSIIVPTKNEPHAPALIRRLYSTFGKNAEIIVVDKSSPGRRKELERTGARVVVQESAGYENALMEGFKLAGGSIIATIDGDSTYYPEDLKKIIEELKKGDYGFVAGARTIAEEGAMTPTLKLGNNFLTGFFNALYRTKMHDVLSGSFAMTKKAFESIKNEMPYRAGTIFFEIELKRRGYGITDVPIRYGTRKGTKPQITRAKPVYGFSMAFHAVRYARDYNPLLIFGGAGVILIILGLIVGGLVIGNYLATGALSEVGRALMAFMLVVVGILAIIAGFILDLLLEIERKIYNKP